MMYDLLITDKTMPHMTGFKLIQEIRKIRNDIPVILCSGFQEKEDTDKLALLGISSFIAKPISMHILADAIRKVLENK